MTIQNSAPPFLPFKNLAGALLFTIFFGPLGLLYSSSMGGIIMLILGFITVCSKMIVPIIFVWIGSSIWSVIATNRYNKKILRQRNS
ncbi:MAG: hypothetical protein JO131_09300 [Gammaproteobacteria bacterium]|nr:hypothetical protein [Gammaproteobacteria bacterium]